MSLFTNLLLLVASGWHEVSSNERGKIVWPFVLTCFHVYFIVD